MVAGTTQELRLQVSALEGQLHASQAHQAEMAQSKEQEIQRLQLLMAESESRLQKELDSKDMASQALQEETQRKEQELEQLTLAHKQLLQQLSQSQEEVGAGCWGPGEVGVGAPGPLGCQVVPERGQVVWVSHSPRLCFFITFQGTQSLIGYRGPRWRWAGAGVSS